METVNCSSPPAEDPRYRVGTLVYTKAGLFLLFTWMLWGDFCVTLMETAWPKIVPLQLKDAGASNFTMGLLAGSLPAAINFIVNPIFGYRSDRFRSRWGRRIPFIFLSAPIVSVLLILFGYADVMGSGVHRMLSWLGLGTSPTAAFLFTFAVLIAVFQVFNVITVSAYPYLFNDVVPRAFMGRFNSLLRIVSTTAMFVFHSFVFGFAGTHRREIYIVAAGLYFVSFMLIALKVKEGEYPPPPQTRGQGLFGAIRTYATECFGLRFYVFFFMANALWALAGTSMMFQTFLGLQVGLSLDQIGKVNGALALATVALLYPVGALVDRLHPLRVFTAAGIYGIVYALLAAWLIRGPASFAVMTLASLPVAVGYSAAQFPMYNAIWPRSRFGQFASAQAMFSAVAIIIGNTLAGRFLDWTGDYRYLYVWQGLLLIGSVTCLLTVYRYWKSYGGAKHYVPPLNGGEAAA